MRRDETFFITGFPGFIANRLVEKLARSTGKIILLVQPSLRERAEEELSRIAALIGREASTFHIVLGDISLPELGLSEVDQQLVHAETTRVFHLAAVYDLAVTRELAIKVNVMARAM